jgi:hypothetical protein
MAGPDLSLLTNAPNLTDRIMQQQQFSNQQGAAQIDLRTKQNLYSSQIMAAAAASGDPQRIQMAKQALASANIDPSPWSDDPAQVKTQATALQQSLMSPMGMLNASIQQEKAGAAVAEANGTKAAGLVPVNAISMDGTNRPAAGAPSLNSNVPVSGGQPTPSTQQIASAMNATPNSAIPAPSASPSSAPPSLNAPVASNAAPAPTQSPQQLISAAQTAALARAQQRVGAAPNVDGLNPKTANELKTAYQNNIDKAMQNDPLYQQDVETAKGIGTEISKQTGASAESEQMRQKLLANVKGLIALNDSTPDSFLASPDTKVDVEKRFGAGQDDATALLQWNNLNKALALNGLQQFVSQSAAGSSIRSNKTIVGMVEGASAIPADYPKASRLADLKNLQAELENTTLASRNVGASITGQPQQPMNAIPVTLPGDDPITAELRRRGAIK